MLENISPEDVLTWELQKLWNTAEIVKETGEHDIDKEYEAAKNGIKIKFPIYYLLQEWYDLYPNTRTANIVGYGKVKLEDFMEEINLRERLLREAIINNIEEGVTGPRGG